ncbi:hypothetical protein PC129_g706 [Phytophthora cactorum]|uniref:Reverse transcriptase domain-containing protein n=1 Tax=Phytophthora cactorum TaxID=29920 RepID=A0A8T0ZX24_9STRA|nr:hypothetical protein PC111_g1446 [Phytophthora cactorum]KAG2867137.1 hypothetical protein PC113_g2208 [Phytophthora cactorum]KAG2930990.1 hypothetical protein PC114_g2318 [Phytophthora cactorum]KAG2942204.1 hypothetical protein PC115_g1577 [Phytophthora cactorum]KAG2952925.1 hypothetical protein PC117_g2404 [Phytophthora cactorum]
MKGNSKELSLEPAVYIHEGSEVMAQLRDQLVLLPELQALSPKCDIEEANVGEPAPARGVECILYVGDAEPVAQRPSSNAPHLAIKVYELLKKLLETGLFEHSESPWASPIVIVLKKNGVDIQMCIDYRIVNGFIKPSNYPLRLIDDLLIGFERSMWFMSLDMASGFWAVRMTERAKLITAFGVVNNCLWGFVKLTPEEEAEIDPDVLKFFQLESSGRDDSEARVPALIDQMPCSRGISRRRPGWARFWEGVRT